MINLPYLSTFDPKTSSEGSIDPLGLFLIADRLATKLVPGVRQRMSHPRFLTLMAVGAQVCAEFSEDELAADGMSEPWQVYEWIVVKMLVGAYSGTDQLLGLPGTRKAEDAMKLRVPISAPRYLKTPTVFGFHGVYRTLAKELDLLTENYLGEFGDELLRAWEFDNGLNGFYSSNNGTGRNLLDRLRIAVREGVKKGETPYKWGWGKEIAYFFHPLTVGRKEKKILFDRLTIPEEPLRHELLVFFASERGQKSWITDKSEKSFHEQFEKIASAEMKLLLKAILSYEAFARMLQDAFDNCIYELSQEGNCRIAQLALLPEVIEASKELPALFRAAVTNLEEFDQSMIFDQIFGHFDQQISPEKWVSLLIQHHNTVQQNKSYLGKRPWFELADTGKLFLHSGHNISKKPEKHKGYLNAYRTTSLWSFLTDLKVV